MASLKIKRVYESPSSTDGLRILVDRVWPRGVSKKKAALDHWMKDAGPSTALRKWFGHKPERWSEFRKRYRKELSGNAALKELRKLVKGHRATLLYGAHDTEHNQAVVLASLLRGRAKPTARRSASSPRKTK
jgi:uncharacterized protein YeaO (DUF488 family)